MNKFDAKDWASSLEAMIDAKLPKWEKHRKWENGGDAIHFMWQWEQAVIKLDIFPQDGQQSVRFRYIVPRGGEDWTWSGLNRKTFRRVEHYAAHWYIRTLHPFIDPEDKRE